MPITLHLRPGAREWYAAWLERTHPELVERYREVYGDRSYAPKAFQRGIGARVAQAARRHGLNRPRASVHRALDDPPPAPAARPPPTRRSHRSVDHAIRARSRDHER